MKEYNSYFYDEVIVVDTIGSKAQQLEAELSETWKYR